MPPPTPLLLLSLVPLALIAVWGLFAQNGGFDEMDAVVAQHPSTNIPALQPYPNLDRGLMNIVAFNLTAANSAATRAFMLQFLANLAIVPVILCTEDFIAAPGSAVRYSTLWGLFSQLCTSAVAYPLYGLSFIRQSKYSSNSSSNNKQVPVHVRNNDRPPPNSAVVLLSVAIGYGIPAILALDLLNHGLKIQIWGILIFAVYPLCVMLTMRLINAFFFVSGQKTKNPTQRQSIATYRYILAGMVGLLGHVWYLSSRPGIAVATTGSGEAVKEGAQLVVLRFLQIDYVITFGAMLLLAGHELSSYGLVPGWGAVAGLVVGWIVLGPGATLGAAWSLREQEVAWTKGDEKESKKK